MKVNELLEAKDVPPAPLVWELVKQRLAKGEKVMVRAREWAGSNKPDHEGIFPVVKVKPHTNGQMWILYFRRPGASSTWVEITPEDDDELELTKQQDGSFLLQYRNPKKWITS